MTDQIEPTAPAEPAAMTADESYAAALAEYEAQNAPATAEPADPAAPAEPAQEQEQEPAAPKVNPNWEAAWKDVPEPIRAAQEQHFRQWDRNYQELEARFSPYKEFEQHGVPAEHIQQALGLLQGLATNPNQFVRDAIERGLVNPAEFIQQQAAAPQQPQTYSPSLEDLDLADPIQAALAQVMQQNAALQARFSQQDTLTQQQQAQAAEAQRQQQYQEQVTQTLSGIEAEFGALDDRDKERIVQRGITNLTMGRNGDLKVAYLELQREDQETMQRLTRQAPQVLGRGGGQVTAEPEQQPDVAKMTDDERLKFAMRFTGNLVQQLNQG